MTGGSESASATIVLTNKLGMHARAQMKFVDTAKRFRGCTIRVAYRGREYNGKSPTDLMYVDAPCGIPIRIEASGEKALDAVAALGELVENRFGETAVAIEFLDPACIKIPLLGKTREEVIRELMDLIEGQHNVPGADRLLSAAMKKETAESFGTSKGLGIALPHAEDKACPGVFTAMGRLQTPLDWPPIDREPVDIIFLTVGPDKCYKKAMIDMSRVLESKRVRKCIRLASNAKELLEVLHKEGHRLSEEIANEIRLRESGHH